MKYKYSNFVTILESNQNQHKTWFLNENNEYEYVEKTFAKYYNFKELAIKNIYEMHDLIKELSYKRNSCIIRGKMSDHAYNLKIKGYKVKRTINEENYTVKDYPKSWIMLDVDNFIVPEGCDLRSDKNRIKVVESFISTLHESFHDSSYVCQFSNGMFLNGNKLKAHIFFMLDKPYLCETLKPWFVKNYTNVDKCIFGSSQIYYIANPKFLNSEDPLRDKRIVFIEKNNNKVNLPHKDIINYTI